MTGTRGTPMAHRLIAASIAALSVGIFTGSAADKHIPEDLQRALAARAPALFLYGADHINQSVNSIRAGEYAEALRLEAYDELVPRRSHRLQIRN